MCTREWQQVATVLPMWVGGCAKGKVLICSRSLCYCSLQWTRLPIVLFIALYLSASIFNLTPITDHLLQYPLVPETVKGSAAQLRFCTTTFNLNPTHVFQSLSCRNSFNAFSHNIYSLCAPKSPISSQSSNDSR